CGSENDSKEIFVRINNRTKEGKSEVWGQARAAYTKYSGDDNSLSGYTDNNILTAKGRQNEKANLGAS
ncbi:MAG: hypothetical protein LE168_04290, partial [Endomicrobium sp.]|nr:hypothetical protein [Endomicrobium sp.]